MSDQAIACDVHVDESGFIAQAVPCAACRYDLRGLRESATCPKCGASIAQSVHLMRVGGRWRRRVAKGIAWIIWGAALSGIHISLRFAEPAYESLYYLVTRVAPAGLMLAGGGS